MMSVVLCRVLSIMCTTTCAIVCTIVDLDLNGDRFRGSHGRVDGQGLLFRAFQELPFAQILPSVSSLIFRALRCCPLLTVMSLLVGILFCAV